MVSTIVDAGANAGNFNSTSGRKASNLDQINISYIGKCEKIAKNWKFFYFESQNIYFGHQIIWLSK